MNDSQFIEMENYSHVSIVQLMSQIDFLFQFHSTDALKSPAVVSLVLGSSLCFSEEHFALGFWQ